MRLYPVHKILTLVSVLAFAGALMVPAVRAENSATEANAVKKTSKADLKKYDKNKDGVLDAEEEAARQADKDKAKAERKAKAEAKKAEKQKQKDMPAVEPAK